MISVSLFNPLCTDCRRPMGEMTQDEFEALILREGSVGKCFDCSGDCDFIPEYFLDMEIGGRLRISGYETIFLSRERIFPSWPIQSHAHERTHARGLSSSTKVNRSCHNTTVLPNGLEVGACPECEGVSVFQNGSEIEVCPTCLGAGIFELAIVIPKWIISHEVTDA